MTEPSPQVVVTTNEAQVADEVIAQLAIYSTNLYQRAGSLCRVIQEEVDVKFLLLPKGSASIQDMPTPSVREEITRRMDILKITVEEVEGEDGKKKKKRTKKCIHPPPWLASAISSRGSWLGIRPLIGLSEAPVMRPDGSIFYGPGYDKQTGVLSLYEGEFPRLPEKVTRVAAAAASARLLDIVADFPFKEPHGACAWLAGLLSIIGRHAFRGPCPMFTMDATAKGTGKTLLADTISYIAFGREFARSGFSQGDEEENRKAITTALKCGHPAFLLDNIEGQFGGACYDRLLTGSVWTDRILGSQEGVTLPASAVWFATGNNIEFRGDITRRIVPLTLQSNEEFPEQRTGFRHHPLDTYILQRRRDLYADALTVLAYFFEAGAPAHTAPAMGSYDDWSRVIRGSLLCLGLPDPAAGRALVAERGDESRSFLVEILSILRVKDPQRRGVTAAQLVAFAEIGRNLSISGSGPAPDPNSTEVRLYGILSTIATGGRPLPTAKSLGMKLNHSKGRNVGGWLLDAGTAKGTALWRAMPVSPAEAAPPVEVVDLFAGRMVEAQVDGSDEADADGGGCNF